jgi:hypothetical protein
VSGYKSGFPEAVTPELDEFYFHFYGGSPSATAPHAACQAGTCPYPLGPRIKPGEPEPEPEASL